MLLRIVFCSLCALQATASGLYIVEKIDLLVAYLVAVPIARWLAGFFPHVRSQLYGLLASAILVCASGMQTCRLDAFRLICAGQQSQAPDPSALMHVSHVCTNRCPSSAGFVCGLKMHSTCNAAFHSVMKPPVSCPELAAGGAPESGRRRAKGALRAVRRRPSPAAQEREGDAARLFCLARSTTPMLILT